eukprot:GSChrysophyteH1.ASY1.ANO1.2797.1 assembled CDS
MDTLIPVVNKLQDVFVVVGSQSVGKSSVLENIVGRDFLPRGLGVVTRRPLILQLYSVNKRASARNISSANHGEEWGEFLHLPGQRFFDFEEIRDEIQRETERVSGKNRGISNKSINLKIYSPHVPTGDQPEDVEEQIRAMCFEFTSNPNAIILAVTAANQDLTNSDGLKIARAVDPEGERTIGVLTKVDIMDAGTDCMDILSNRVVPLRRGYIAVCNRSQKDIIESRSIRDGLSKEQMYFLKHPKYRNIPSKCGTQNLARMLNQILMLHIRDSLPDIKSKIMTMMVTVQANIDALGESTHDQGAAALGATLLQLLSKFARCFADSVEGRGSSDGKVEMSELCGGARISSIFNDIFGHIRIAIANANGTRPSLFVPEIAFDLLVKKQIEKLLQPGLQCVDLVFDEMQRMAFQSENPELARFPELRDRILISIELAYINTSHPDFIGGKQAVAQLNKRFQQQQQQQLQQQQQQQQNISGESPEKLNTSRSGLVTSNSGGGVPGTNNAATDAAAGKGFFNFDFVRLPHVPDKMKTSGANQPTEREKVETEIIKALIQSYFDIVKKNFMDMVPKTIMHFLVNTFKENLQNELVKELYRENIMTDLMREKQDVEARRKACREMKDLLRRGLEIVNEVRDFNTFK